VANVVNALCSNGCQHVTTVRLQAISAASKPQLDDVEKRQTLEAYRYPNTTVPQPTCQGRVDDESHRQTPEILSHSVLRQGREYEVSKGR
jgi:hypothetical protein